MAPKSPGRTSECSRRSTTVLYPFSASHAQPAGVGKLPPARRGSTALKCWMPGAALIPAGFGEGSALAAGAEGRVSELVGFGAASGALGAASSATAGAPDLVP